MKRPRLVLINPVNPARVGLTVNRSSRFPPIGLGIVAAVTPSSWKVKLLDENWESFSYQDADLVGITAFTASANRAYEIASIYRQRRVPVVIGGIHASIRPEEALQYVDAVVIGEAEAVWLHVISDVEAGHLQKIYKGGWTDLSGAPNPRRDLFHPRYMFASVQTSRGCPMDCEFCSVTAFNGKRYRRRPPGEVLAELETIPEKRIFFVDDNIIGYGKESRDQALAIFKGMVERKLNKWWFCQASLNFGDDEEVLFWARRAGCRMVFLGLEAEDEGALEEVHKQLNIKRGVDYYSQAFRRINKAGIAVLGAFIFGMDGDTADKLQQRADFMIRSQIDVMQTTFLTPLAGTRVFDRYYKENRLLYTNFPIDWNHYDMTEVIHRPGSMEPEQLSQKMIEIHRQIYAWPVLLRKAVSTLKNTRSFTSMMFALMSNMNYRRVAPRK
ncbi:MAG: radical SAM protein [Desulfomonilia bacterium]|jgi:radical SAM superfamily enzyme YgiQ (UPF0313 family)